MTQRIELKGSSQEQCDLKITTTKLPMAAPKKYKGVLNGKWKTETVSEKEMASLFSTFDSKKDKKKRAASYCMASFQNNVRKKDHLQEVFGFSYDYDNGYTMAEFEQVVKDKGYLVFVYETYTSSSDKEKFRAVFPFSQAVKYSSIKNWRDLHCGFATSLGLPTTYDPTCFQSERLFFLPVRHPDATEGKHFHLTGSLVDSSSIEPVKYVRPLREGETEESRQESAGKKEPLFIDIEGEQVAFRAYWSDRNKTKLSDLIEEHAPDKVRKGRDVGGVIIECPYDAEHSNPDDPKDTATFADNPNEKHQTATVRCLHGSCEHRDTADFVHKMILDEWFDVSVLVTKDAQVSDFIEGLKEGVPDQPAVQTCKNTLILPPGFDYRGTKITVPNGNGKRKPICNRINFTGLGRDYDGNEWLLVCEVTTPDGQINEIYVPKRHAGKDTALEDLRGAGAAIYDTPGMKKILAFVEPSNKCRLVQKGGWYDDKFVLTGEQVEVFGDDTGEQVIYTQTTKLKPKFNVAGSLSDWKTHIATPVQGNNLLQFVLCSAFAAPLLTPMNVGGGGFHLVGKSSIGKTVALQIFGSVFGGEKYITSYRGTDNAMESVCEMHNDAGLAIDELSQADAASFGETVYMMANGEGKNRANNFGDSKGTKTWRNMLLSSGEMTISDKVAENKFGAAIKGGQSVRLVDLLADAGKDMGIVEVLNGTDSSKVFVDALSAASKENYGTAIREFLAYITKDTLYASQELQERRKQFVDAVVPADADGQIGRIADRFAICAVAGELAIEAGILPWKKGEAVKVCTYEFERFIAIRGYGSFEVAQGVAAVEQFLVVNAARFQNHNHPDTEINNRIGWFKDNGKTGIREYFIPCANWSEVCGGYSPDAVAQTLADKGELYKHKDGKLMKAYRPKGLSTLKCRVLIQDGRTKKQQAADAEQLVKETVYRFFGKDYKPC